MIAKLISLLIPAYAASGGLIYQGASVSLSSTPSLVTYLTKMPMLGSPITGAQLTSSEAVDPHNKFLYTDVSDSNYLNGIYTCATQGTYSVGASLSVAGTLAVNSSVVMTIALSTDGGTSWTNLRTTGQGPTTGLGKSYGYVPFLVPCPAGGKIRILASVQNLLLPTVSGSPDENTLSITKIF